ncbi:hypothetical protein B0H10DRAFT_1737150, partial [Mycena sp. CBHHK59/15]
MSKHASVEAQPSKAPILSSGNASPAVIREWELACLTYFDMKSIETKVQVAMVMGGLRDHHITDWLAIDDDRAAAKALAFKPFMVEVRKRLLPTDWEREARIAIVSTCQTMTQSFWDFAASIHAQNSILINTGSHFSDERLCVQLEAAMLPDLSADYHDDAIAPTLTDFPKWLDALKRIDDKCLRSFHCNKAFFEAEAKKRGARNDNNDRPNKHTNSSSNRENQAPPSGSSSGAGTKHCPQLTEAERTLLDDNHGCRRCRKPFVTHQGRDQVCSFPPPDNYKPVMQGSIDTALKSLSLELLKTFGLSRPTKTVAAIVRTQTVAAVLPDIEDEDDSTDKSDLSNRVSPHHHREPHHFWDFLMEGPNTNLPLDVNGLIDGGAHLVLIDPDLVDKLGLRRHPLNKPEVVDVAINSEDPNDRRSTELSEYV